jgi:serine protease Do
MKTIKIMQNKILLSLVAVGVIGSITLIAKNQEAIFNDAPSNPTHRLPNSTGEILSFNSILKDSVKSVVNISTKTKAKQNQQLNSLLNDPFFREFFGGQLPQGQPKEKMERSLGSGVIVSNNGYIITNNHVIDGADEITVMLDGSSKEYNAKLIGKDKGSDLAVIKIEATNLIPIKFSHIEDVQVGDVVFAIGNPFGIGQTTTQGIVSALNKHGVGINQYENFIQTDASINPGNSGGALVDSRGALIGINSAILSKSGGNNGIGFAIPINMVKNIATQLISKGEVQRGFMGVNISPITPEMDSIYRHQEGAVIVDIEEDSPASRAGIQRGDLVYQVENIPIKEPFDLQNTISSYPPNQNIKLYIERDGKDITTNISLADSSKKGSKVTGSKNSIFEGLELASLDNNLKKQLQIPTNISGAMVVEVDESSKAGKAGFLEGDIIVQIENVKITSAPQAVQTLQSFGDRAKRIYVNRNGYILVLVSR